MIKRIVRLSFQPEKVQEFLQIFESSKQLISNFEGCLALSLYQDYEKKNVFYTESIWKSIEHLENYRNSELFQSTWLKTKVLFNEKPQAFSLAYFETIKPMK
jgi:quinol monooxygenase YgiN